MQTLLLFVVVGLIGGVAVAIQSPLASMIGQRLGVLESIFIIHIGGAIIVSVPLLAARGGRLAEWRTVPWYALLAGGLGLLVIGAINYTIPRLGVTTTTILVVAGQIAISLLIDHFGLLGTQQRPVDLARVLGVVIVFVGIWLVIR
ncbi:MAG: DMT family transporter [Anaerolineae bacterium]|nr:DMT family transporter [Anaerolineae bacterium]